MSSVTNEYDRLRRFIIKLKYPHNINKNKILCGYTTELLPVINFCLLEYSKNIAKFISQKGYDLYGKNDLNFTESFYGLLRKEFEYNPILQYNQFLTEKGYAKRKIQFVCDIIKIIINKNKELNRAKIIRNGNKTSWKDTQFSKKVDQAIKKSKENKETNVNNGNNDINSKLKSLKKRKKKLNKNKDIKSSNNNNCVKPKNAFAGDDKSWEFRSNIPTPSKMVVRHEVKATKTVTNDDDAGNNDNNSNTNLDDIKDEEINGNNDSNDGNNESTFCMNNDAYNPNVYVQSTNATMEMNNPKFNPYMTQNDNETNMELPVIHENMTQNTFENNDVNDADNNDDSKENTDNNDSNDNNGDNGDDGDDGRDDDNGNDSNNNNDEKKDDEIKKTDDDNDEFDENKSSKPSSDSHNIPTTSLEAITMIMKKLENLEKKFDKSVANINARLIVIEGKMRFYDDKINNNNDNFNINISSNGSGKKTSTDDNDNKSSMTTIGSMQLPSSLTPNIAGNNNRESKDNNDSNKSDGNSDAKMDIKPTIISSINPIQSNINQYSQLNYGLRPTISSFMPTNNNFGLYSTQKQYSFQTYQPFFNNNNNNISSSLNQPKPMAPSINLSNSSSSIPVQFMKYPLSISSNNTSTFSNGIPRIPSLNLTSKSDDIKLTNNNNSNNKTSNNNNNNDIKNDDNKNDDTSQDTMSFVRTVQQTLAQTELLLQNTKPRALGFGNI